MQNEVNRRIEDEQGRSIEILAADVEESIRQIVEFGGQPQKNAIVNATRDIAILRTWLSGWIPATEQLPEENDWYIVTCAQDIGANYTARARFDGGCFRMKRVIAWQSIPSPYEPTKPNTHRTSRTL